MKLRMQSLVVASAAITLGALALSAQSPGQASALGLTHEYSADGNSLRAGEGVLLRIGPRLPLRYLGGQRFVIGGTAAAEQHAFVDADADGNVRRAYWIQFESMLPTTSSTYDYSSDPLRTVGGIAMRTNVRRYTAEPDSGSDRDHFFRLVRGAGLRLSLPAARARMVYLPDSAARREVMIIYVESGSAFGAELSAEGAEALLGRAIAGLRLEAATPRP